MSKKKIKINPNKKLFSSDDSFTLDRFRPVPIRVKSTAVIIFFVLDGTWLID